MTKPAYNICKGDNFFYENFRIRVGDGEKVEWDIIDDYIIIYDLF